MITEVLNPTKGTSSSGLRVARGLLGMGDVLDNMFLRDSSAHLDVLGLAFQTFIFPEGTPIPGAGGRTLRRSLTTRVEVTPDGFVIGSGEIDEESYGQTFDEAYADFLTSIRDRYESVSRREDRLSEHDQGVLKMLRSLLGST